MTAARFIHPRELSGVVALLKHSNAEVETEILGGSMGATLPSGARIRIACSDRADYRPGDVLVVLHRAGLVAHRLVRRGRGVRARAHLITRGDATTACDVPVPLERAVGLVTAWREGDTDSWRPLGAPANRGVIRRSIATANETLIGTLLEVHPPLACRVAAAVRWCWSLRRRLRGERGPLRP